MYAARWMPLACAAISLSRTARSARPVRVRLMLAAADDQERGDRHHQIVAGGVGRQDPGAQPRGRHAEAVVAAGEPVEDQDRLDHHEPEREGRHRQVEALESQARHAQGQPHRGGDEAGDQQGQGYRQRRGADREDRRRVRADRQEARVPERELVRVAREEVQSDRHDRVDGDQARQEHEVARRGPRPADHDRGAGGERGAAHQTFRRATRPSTPPGRTIRIVIMTRNGTECLIEAGR